MAKKKNKSHANPTFEAKERFETKIRKTKPDKVKNWEMLILALCYKALGVPKWQRIKEFTRHDVVDKK